jgi:cellulose synthase/poly-beta-1,6-N-acetylglucosamine synthase-like glycosyltransferase
MAAILPGTTDQTGSGADTAPPVDPWLVHQPVGPGRSDTFPIALLRQGLIRSDDMIQALAVGARRGHPVSGSLVARGALSENDLLSAATRHFGAARVDPLSPLPDASLIDQFGLTDCLRHRLLPWRRAGAATVVVTARPEEFSRLRPLLEERLGPVLMALAPAALIEQALHARRGARMANLAELRVASAESCRDWGRSGTFPTLAFGAFACIFLLWLAPLLVLFAALGVAVFALLLSAGLKLAAVVAALRPAPPEPPPPQIARLPTVSIIVALYREGDIATRLVRRLSRLDYPRDLLDVIIAVEADDHATRDALIRAGLPPWMRVITAPEGRIKTKPRALNIALDHCRGTIIGVYDAEDAPEPDQIRKVVDRFHRRGPDVACLQGMLDYYNPRTNWMSRCFTIEYAAWFRLMLPGVARLGLAVPLGGTTLFFRRAVLEELGGWDAHNVTEDADLGIRLARHGYRTELIETVTLEEANCRPLAWVRQRSRWIKGYMMTWIVHMRDPWLLWRQLGPRRFAGFQIMFLGSVLQTLLAPLIWSFWLVPFGVPHPLADSLPAGGLPFLIAIFLLSEALNIVAGILALRRTRHRLSPLWVPTLHAYFPLAALAAYKAVWELIASPFYWDKTRHGVFDSPEAR